MFDMDMLSGSWGGVGIWLREQGARVKENQRSKGAGEL